MGVTRDKVIKFKINNKHSRSFRVIVFGAYNAYGLIGPEHNGIAVLDEDNRSVLCDRIAEESSGYFGPSERQLESFDNIAAMTWAEFRELINAHSRTRYKI
jgi:hypothetical protein